MMTKAQILKHQELMVRPVEHQELIDELSALVLLKKVDGHAANAAINFRDWETVRELIQEAEDERPR
jgi:hypothetical protein